MTTKHYPDIEANPNFPAMEEDILRFWESHKSFETSVTQRPAAKADGSSNAYVFYDGPPFANGLPHYGHLLTGYVKDAIARYHTMKGARVERRFGWDCHGLPAEMGAEKELNISGRAAIMDYGIGKFNEHCRTSVMKYTQDWEYYVTRQGRWVDFKNDYKTMDRDFMESVIWAYKQLHDKGLTYESMRVMPYSWAAETPVSNFETRIDNATRPREDKAAYVKFKLKAAPQEIGNVENCYLVAWTTTPWTLPSNLALAVGDLDYGYIEIRNKEGVKEVYIAATSYLPKLALELDKQGYQITFVEAANGKGEKTKLPDGALVKDDLIGLKYEPLFPYFVNRMAGGVGAHGMRLGIDPIGGYPKAFHVLDGSEFVTEGDGTGIVHMAPGFGEVDYDVCKKNGIEAIVPVDEKGKFTAEIYDLADLKLQGLTVVPDTRIAPADITVAEEDKALHIAEKDVQKYGLANMRIVRWLKANNKLVKDEAYTHNYPHCWRTDTPLIYRAMSSWYVNVQAIKSTMAANNQNIRWIPDHVRDGQMGKGIESAPDWSISRNRFWGTPIPVWKSASGKIHVCGSIEEIEKLSGQKVEDLHRPYIDEVVLKIDGEDYHRIEDVFDCWFESGSMPFAQLHYPFENKERFEREFPADFITEYIAQTRGWFYTLQVLSAALFGHAPFKNVICHGVVIDEETGLKYSKRLKNYRDPKEVMDAYGADALRWMMLASPVMRGSDLGVDPEGKFIRDVVRLNIKPLWSAFNFFTLYANADGVQAKQVTRATNLLDQYILAKAKAAVTQVQTSLDAYDTPGATEAITGFFDVLNNWYIRRSRSRFWAEEVHADKQSAYDTLFTVLNLMCMAAAPLLPFTAEAIYRGLNGSERSVHLQDFPDVSGIDSAVELVADMDWVRDVCNTGSAIRNKQNIRNRQPLDCLSIYGENPIMRRRMDDLKNAEYFKEVGVYWKTCAEIIQDELNVHNVKLYQSQSDFEQVASRKLVINSQKLGKRLPKKMKQILPASKKGEWEYVSDDSDAIIVAGEMLNSVDEEYSIILEPKAGYEKSAQACGNAVVVLDLTITPELEAEGRARDLVRMIQQARKDAGLNVADRITLALDVPADFKAALATHGAYIASQTLATSVSEGSASADQKMTQELDGEQFIIGISKAA